MSHFRILPDWHISDKCITPEASYQKRKRKLQGFPIFDLIVERPSGVIEEAKNLIFCEVRTHTLPKFQTLKLGKQLHRKSSFEKLTPFFDE